MELRPTEGSVRRNRRSLSRTKIRQQWHYESLIELVEPVLIRTGHTLIAQIFSFHECEQLSLEVGFSHVGSRAEE